MSRADRVIRAARDLRTAVDALAFAAPVTHVYNPLGYAWRGQRAYLKRFADSKKRVVFLGMNPGPFGMSQTGVPFGEVALVRDFVGIEERIDAPPNEHPKRPVQGFACTRSEVSGSRLWGAIQQHWKTPERFFAKHFIANYCPLVFMEDSGRNRTPDKLPAHEREPLYAACNRHLERVISILEPEWVIGIGAFAAKRASEVLGDRVQIGTILHPSPANPRANRNWEGEVRTQLADLGLCGTRRGAS